MPRRATAMMAVLAVIIHCVLGCCARCLHASEHHDHTSVCETNCQCCEHHHHHDAGIELCLQPAFSWLPEAPHCEAHSDPDHECPGLHAAKCVFISKKSASDGLTDALLLPVNPSWLGVSGRPLANAPQFQPLRFPRQAPAHNTPKLRLHLSLAVLTL
ncbi:hypothetical protein AB1K70_06245 [Bremerella sp. JC770]|uniref:hypothetical protein n=1 Tax=Bremerella sp. JC770 TaxID=3232137 RepID=UPI003457A0C9